MGLFQWDNSYTVGYAAIDNQHQKWFQLAHEVHSAVVTGKAKEILKQTLASFIAYTKGHFASEERLMLTNGYADFQEHKDQHQALTRKLIQVQRDLEDGRATVAMEFLQFLKIWLGHHINVVDSRLGAYLSEKGR
jgi:hemerythrin